MTCDIHDNPQLNNPLIKNYNIMTSLIKSDVMTSVAGVSVGTNELMFSAMSTFGYYFSPFIKQIRIEVVGNLQLFAEAQLALLCFGRIRRGVSDDSPAHDRCKIPFFNPPVFCRYYLYYYPNIKSCVCPSTFTGSHEI